MSLLSPSSSTQSSMANLLFFKRNLTKNFWAFALSLSLLRYDIALLVTLTKSWRHFRLHHSMSNFRALSPDCFWSPNARTPNPNSVEALLHCTACTKLQDSRNLTWCQLPNLFGDICTLIRSGKEFNPVGCIRTFSLMQP